MEIKQIYSSRCQKALKEIYENSFPENERVPFSMLFDKSVFPNYQLHAFYENKELIGFTYTLVEKELKIAFLGYIAVRDGLRSQTKGSQMISFLKNLFPDYAITVNIESSKVQCPNLMQRKLRENFYFKNDFKFAGLEFVNREETFNSYYFGNFNQQAYINLMHSYFPELSNMKISKI